MELLKSYKKMYIFDTNNYSYLDVTNDGWLNQYKNEAYDLQWTNSKILMTITIMIDHMSMQHVEWEMIVSIWM